jgi:hypothetical protein
MLIDFGRGSKSQIPPVLDDLSEIERAVVDAARRGVWVEPDTLVEVEELAATEDAGLQVRAVVIRELLMGHRGDLDPRGLRLRGVRVVGQLDLDHVPAITSLLLVKCAMPEGVTCRYARLREMILTGSLVSVLHADGLRTDGNLFLRDATMHGADEDGTVRLPGAHIGGHLDLTRIEVTNDTGPALHADGLRTNGPLLLRDATMHGAGERGTVRLLGAHIGDLLDLTRIEVTNDTGPALDADRLCTDNILFLRDATMHGAGETGTLRLPAAHIGSQTHMAGIQLTNDSGPLVSLSEAQLEGALFLPASVVCPTGSTEVTRGCADYRRQMTVGGLVFPRLRDVSWRQWLHLLVHHTPDYMPQPYQQLAAVERAAGHDNNARQVLITQQEDLRRRTPEALGGRIGRARHWLWGWLGRYGYRAHRLVITLALVLTLAGGLGYAAGQIPTRPGHHAAERVPSPTVTPGTPCSTAELIGLGIDRGLPLGTTGLRARCDLDTGTRWGQAFTYAIWVLQALVWALATLAIAAYTGLVRKPT